MPHRNYPRTPDGVEQITPILLEDARTIVAGLLKESETPDAKGNPPRYRYVVSLEGEVIDSADKIIPAGKKIYRVTYEKLTSARKKEVKKETEPKPSEVIHQ